MFKSKLTTAGWSLVAGAVAALVVLVPVTHVLVTAGGAQQMAEDRVVAAMTPVCIRDFMAQPNVAVAWGKLHETNDWDRKKLLTGDNWRWVRIPGQTLDERELYNIRDKCIDGIMAKPPGATQASAK